MNGFALVSNFACDRCGAPSIVLPETLEDMAPIRCSGCGDGLGTWGAFKQRTRQLILADVASGEIDPREAGVDLALRL
jgi:hypothetical protein